MPDLPVERPTEEALLTQYEVISDRRISLDTMLWQAPVLCLTAQAFLLAIALNPGSLEPSEHDTKCENQAAAKSAAPSVILASLLSMFVSLGCIQLMAKHRIFEVKDSKSLEELEKILRLKLAHEQPSLTFRGSSYHWWFHIMAVFAVIAAYPLLKAACTLFEWNSALVSPCIIVAGIFVVINATVGHFRRLHQRGNFRPA